MCDQQKKLYDLALRISDYPEKGQLLRQKRDSVPTVRAVTDDGESVVIKYFRHQGMAGYIRRMLGKHSAYREWVGLSLMAAQGARVPQPLGYFQLVGGSNQHTHAVVTADLGHTMRGSDYLERLLEADDKAGLQQLNLDLIDATQSLIAADLLDGDHTLTNFAIPSDGRAYRLDLECSRNMRGMIRHTNWFAETLGRLIATYAFNSHRYNNHASEFARQLIEKVKPSQKVIVATRQRVAEMITVHNRNTGGNARIDLSW